MELVDQPDPDMSTGVEALTSPVRRAIVDALGNYRPEGEAARSGITGMTAAQLATMLDLHVTTIRFHLDRLVVAGLVTSDFTRVFGVGRPRKVYDLRPGSLDEEFTQAGAQALMQLLADTFDTDLTPEEAGELWAQQHVPRDTDGIAASPGQWLTKVARMIDVLGDWGYTPDLSTSNGGRTCRIDVTHCPFLELAERNPAVVCGIHRGLISGAMAQLGENDLEVSLEPFVEPHRCQAHVSTNAPFRSNPETTRSGP